mmetsp:Transcript_67035/g.132189  ORF Transcript_67035/g.132189 Transcript_67035/m.132189 type:complete len:331 (+) Transcript_67035:61-1053(+)
MTLPIKQDPYSVLGILPGAGSQEVRRAYHALALRWHPDKRPVEERDAAEQEFKTIGLAYDILRDATKQRECNVTRTKPCNPTTCEAPAAKQPTARNRTPFHSDKEPKMPSGCPGIRIEKPPCTHIWFARSSACVGRAYKGLEAADVAQLRQAALESVALWITAHPHVVINVRGCSQMGEVSTARRVALAQARSKRAVEFLIEQCQVPETQCRDASQLGEDFQGVEIGAMTRAEVDGAFTSHDGLLCDAAILEDVAAAIKRTPDVHLLVEVWSSGDLPMAKHRLTALQQSFARRNVSRDVTHGRIRRGPKDEAQFFLYTLSAPRQDSAGVD